MSFVQPLMPAAQVDPNPGTETAPSVQFMFQQIMSAVQQSVSHTLNISPSEIIQAGAQST
jgi:hypothetical protein